MSNLSHVTFLKQKDAVVPKSIESVKIFAKELYRNFPNSKLADCQQCAAHVFGHESLHALEEAIKRGEVSGPLDEDLSDEELHRRFIRQWGLVCLELGNVLLDDPYEPPEPSETLSSNGLKSLLRIEAAAARATKLLAQEVLMESGPTRGFSLGEVNVLPYEFILPDQDTMENFNERIAIWWRKNIPEQPGVADALSSYSWDRNRRASIIRFGMYWGELCMHYAHTINWTMCMGTALLLAEQYTWIEIFRGGMLLDIADAAGDKDIERAIEEMNKFRMKEVQSFLGAYVRDDMIAAGYVALEKNAIQVMKILKTPNSRRGIWKKNRR